MKMTTKLLVEQAWGLRTVLGRDIEIEKKRRLSAESPYDKIERLNLMQQRAYSRYLRRLKKYWA